MTPAELRSLLASGGVSQSQAARLLKVDLRTIGRYVQGSQPIPIAVEIALTCLIRHSQSGDERAQS